MDALLVSLRELKAALEYQGSNKELCESGLIARYCEEHQLIAKVRPQDLSQHERDRYTSHLIALTRVFLAKHPSVKNWNDFTKRTDTRRVNKLLFEYGVRAEVFPDLDLAQFSEPQPRSATSLTLPEFYEVCQIKFHFNGSFLSFKRIVQRQYGSFAEYCLSKGYDINTTKWESDETALRVAQKLGSLDEVRRRSKSLYKYLEQHKLLGSAFQKNSA